MKKYIICLVFIMSALGGFGRVEAATEIPSYLDEDLHLTKAGSPYQVTGNNGLYVSPGHTITIDPGVVLLLSSGWFRIDQSKLYIGNASSSEKVVLNVKPSVRDWGGIYLNKAEANIYSLEIRGSRAPVTSSHSNAILSNVLIDGNNQKNAPIGIYATGGSLEISSSTLTHFTINSGLQLHDTNGSIKGSIVSGNRTGIFYGGTLVSNFSGSSNLFSANTVFQIYNNNTPTTLNFRENDWGTGGAPKEGSVFGKVVTGFEEGVTCCSNTVFLPGLMGSRLFKDDNQLWEPNINADVEKLYMDNNGKSLDISVYVGEILNRTNVAGPFLSQKIYESFIEKMDKMVADKKINKWKSLPYDWRLDPKDVVENEVLISEIENMASSSKTGKVSIVAHSNGGLIAKRLVSHLHSMNKAGIIDNIILVASPQIGAPDTVKTLLHGDNFGLPSIVLSKKNVREWGENLPVAYNLLPSESYLNTVNLPVITLDSSLDKINEWRTVYGDSISSQGEFEDFLLGKEGRLKPVLSDNVNPNILNESLLNQSKNNHSNFDQYVFPSPNVFQIVGWGQSTPSGIRYFASPYCGFDNFFCIRDTELGLDHDVSLTNDGDGTVVTPSAEAYQNASSTYFVNMKEINESLETNYKHSTIFELPSVLDLVERLIVNEPTGTIKGVSNEKPESAPFVNLEISVHSPVNIHAYNAKGNHTGIISSLDSDLTFTEEGIPNSSYAEVGEGKYINIQGAKPVILKLEGTAVGSFTLEIKKEGVENQNDIQFVGIPVTDETRGEIQITSLSSTTLSLDTNGDNEIDFIINPNTEADPSLYLKVLKQNILSFNLNSTTEKLLVNKIDKVLKSLTKDKNKIAVKKLSHFSARLEDKHWKLKELSENNRGEIITLINETLDSL